MLQRHRNSGHNTPARYTIYCGNKGVVRSFYKGRSNNHTINVCAAIFTQIQQFHHVNLKWVYTKVNPADAPSRDGPFLEIGDMLDPRDFRPSRSMHHSTTSARLSCSSDCGQEAPQSGSSLRIW
jgi:hypothetical protein